jgi:hypothetical protein
MTSARSAHAHRTGRPHHRRVSTTSTVRRPAAPRLALLVPAAGLALLLAAIVLAAGVIGRGTATPAAGHHFIGQDIPTSFGAIAIDSLGRSPREQSQMVAFVALTNLAHRPAAYSAAQFRLLGGPDRTPVAGLRTTFTSGTIQPAASFSGQITFPQPGDGSKRWIEYRDPDLRKPIVIDLSKVGPMTPDSAFDRFLK